MEVGDRVKLREESRYWEQSGDSVGVIINVRTEEGGDFGFEPHPYTVVWENGDSNVYRECDLEFIGPRQARPIQGKSKLEFNFLRK